MEQFTAEGAYCQHSTNYHRLALQLGLWFYAVSGMALPEKTLARLDAASRWLLALAEPASGAVPNLGPNDGADLLPSFGGPFADFRPTLQAACLAFCSEKPFPPGPWDELAEWLGIDSIDQPARAFVIAAAENSAPLVMRTRRSNSWAYLRVAQFNSRPGHADQLHLDLWWNSTNVARDAGTYLYNAPPPWDNALATAAVHNTLTINNRDQMLRSSRFLYLNWAQASLVDRQEAEDLSWQRLVTRHDGYRRLGVTHQRAVTARAGDHWVVVDTLLISDLKLARRHAPFSIRLNWLLADYSWELTGSTIRLSAPGGSIELTVEAQDGVQPGSRQFSIVRGGELRHGPGPVNPTWGWLSPTYGVKIPALAIIFNVSGWPPVNLVSEWKFTPNSDTGKLL